MFTTNHFIWLAISLLFIVLLCFISFKKKLNFKQATALMCIISILSELTKIFAHMKPSSSGEGMVLLAKSLPLHLCSILVFMFFFLFLSKNEERKEIIKSFVVTVSLIGGVLALLLATSGVEFNKPQPYQSFLYHAAIVWYAIYLLKTKQVDMGLKAYKRNIIIMIVLVFIMLWVNSILQIYDTNFFFLVSPPASGLPVLNLNHGWYVYFIHLLVVGIILVTLVHLKWIISDIKEKRNNNY